MAVAGYALTCAPIHVMLPRSRSYRRLRRAPRHLGPVRCRHAGFAFGPETNAGTGRNPPQQSLLLYRESMHVHAKTR